jgi:hypothetical protein
MGGYAAPPADEPRPATAQQADQQNKIGNANKKATGQAYWEQDQQQAAQQQPAVQQQEQNPYNPLLQPGRYSNWLLSHPAAAPMQKAQAEYEYHEEMVRVSNINRYAVESRAGYTPPEQIGDINTQRLLQQRASQNMSSEQRYALLGAILESQRQEAYKTQTLSDDRYFEGEIGKWGENYVEKGSAQHFYLKDTGQVGTNPYEYQADLAVEFLKGTPQKRSEFFSPVSGQMSPFLPGGKGVQEYSWDKAVATARGTAQPEPVSFMGAVERLGSARGTLFAPSYEGKAGNASIEVFGEANAKRPFTSILANTGKIVGNDWNPFIVGASEPIGYISDGIQVGKPTPPEKMSGFPAGIYPTGEFGIGIPKSTVPRYLQYQQNIRSTVQMFFRGDFGGAVSELNTALTQLTSGLPGVKGMGKDFRTYSSQPGFGNIETPFGTVKTPAASLVTGIGEGSEGMYTDVKANPLTYIALYELPLIFKGAEFGLGSIIAGSAKSGYPIISTLGRAGSTPAAITWGNVAKTAMGAYFVGGAGYNIYTAPPEERNKVTGITIGQFMAVGAGLPQAARYTPKVAANPFESRTFFSGERKLPASEKFMIRAGDLVTGLTKTKGQKVAIQAISAEYNKNLFTKPEITTIEPNYAELTHVGPKNAAAVKAAMVDQPSVLYGSGTIKAQVNPKTPMGKVLFEKAGTSADADIFAEFPKIMEAKAGKAAAAGMDVHTFTPGYPDVGQGTNAPIEPGSYLFGNRYRVNPYIDEMTLAGKTKGYTGETSFEHLNVGFRKYSSAMRDDILDPMNKGYRLGKDLSRGTRTSDYLAEIQQGRKPSTIGQTSAFDEMLKQEITYNAQVGKTGKPNILTETLGEARARYEGNPKETPDMFSKYSKGAVSSLISSVASGSVMASLGKVSASAFISKVSSPSNRPSSPVSSMPASSVMSSLGDVSASSFISQLSNPSYRPSSPILSIASIRKSSGSSPNKSISSLLGSTPASIYSSSKPVSDRSNPSSLFRQSPSLLSQTSVGSSSGRSLSSLFNSSSSSSRRSSDISGSSNLSSSRSGSTSWYTKNPTATIPYLSAGIGGSGGSPFGNRQSSPWSRRNLVGAELFMNKKKKGKRVWSPFG